MSSDLIKRSVRLPEEIDKEIVNWARAHLLFFPDGQKLNFSDVVRVGMSWFLAKVSPQTPIPGIDNDEQ